MANSSLSHTHAYGAARPQQEARQRGTAGARRLWSGCGSCACLRNIMKTSRLSERAARAPD
eukprot:6207297-Pleurochrysis_carterae.AAC.1